MGDSFKGSLIGSSTNEVWHLYSFVSKKLLWRGRCCIFAEGCFSHKQFTFWQTCYAPSSCLYDIACQLERKNVLFQAMIFLSFKYIKLSFLSVLYAAASQRPSQTESRRHPWNVLPVAVYFHLTNFIYSASVQRTTELHLVYVMVQLLWKLERRSSPPAPNSVTFARQPTHCYMANCIWNKTH